MGHSRRRSDGNAMGYARKEEAETWWFHSWPTEIVAGEDRSTRESYFHRRFKMSINLFKRIAKELKKYDRFFEQRRNAAGKLGHSTEQKVTDALCMLVYGIPADLVDDHFFFQNS
jgi:hypothetical protein